VTAETITRLRAVSITQISLPVAVVAASRRLRRVGSDHRLSALPIGKWAEPGMSAPIARPSDPAGIGGMLLAAFDATAAPPAARPISAPAALPFSRPR
jgi:hypothetical protein